MRPGLSSGDSCGAPRGLDDTMGVGGESSRDSHDPAGAGDVESRAGEEELWTCGCDSPSARRSARDDLPRQDPMLSQTRLQLPNENKTTKRPHGSMAASSENLSPHTISNLAREIKKLTRVSVRKSPGP